MPSSLETLVAFSLATAVIIAAPGPTIALIVANSLSGGLRVGFSTIAAVLLADVLLIAAIALFFESASGWAQANWTEISLVCAALLVWLGTQQIRKAASGETPLASIDAVSSGFLSTALNPKTLLFFGAFMPQFIDASAPIAPQALLLSICFVVVSAPIAATYAFAAARLKERVERNQKLLKLTRYLSGVTLIVIASVSLVSAL